MATKGTMIRKLILATIILLALLPLRQKPEKELRWNWDTIDTDSVVFPEGFQFCVATAEYQVSGSECYYTGAKRQDCPESNWSHYEEKNPAIESSGKGADHWNNYKEDVQLIKQLGVTVYRCSLDWSRIQPREGFYDPAAIQHYRDLFDELKRNNITPMVTLHHFINPSWFEDKGAFEKEENITHFVDFARHMFNEFKNNVPYWCTINEPGVYAAQTYIMGQFPRPPGTSLGFPCNVMKTGCFYGAALVTKHLMMAHIATYNAIKALPGGSDAQIGIVHNIIHFEPYHPGNWLESIISRTLSHVYSKSITQFLLTGSLIFKTPFAKITFDYPAIRDAQDYIGLNYYSHILIKWSDPLRLTLRPEDGELSTDMHYGIYPEGLYRALKELAPIGKPIYITENGLADSTDALRQLWYKRYLYAVSRAIQEGVDVRMFCAWSLLDNFEWNLGYKKKFGLYAVDPVTYKRRLKRGAEYFRKIAQRQSLHKQ